MVTQPSYDSSSDDLRSCSVTAAPPCHSGGEPTLLLMAPSEVQAGSDPQPAP